MSGAPQLLPDPRREPREWTCLQAFSGEVLSGQELAFDDDPFDRGRRIPRLPERIGFESFMLRLAPGVALDGLRNIVAEDFWFCDRVLAPHERASDVLRGDLRSGLRPENSDGRGFRANPSRQLGEDIALAVSDEPSNWGSYLCRILPKLIRFKELGAERILAYCAGRERLELLDLIGLARDRVLPHDSGLHYRFQSALYLSEPTNALYLEPRARSDLRRLGDRFRTAPIRRLYVSRSSGLATRSGRRCLNEGELEAALSGLGVEIVHPDLLSVREQIALFSNAELIVGCSGAGMFNAVFSPGHARVIEIESSSAWSYAHTGLFSSLGLRHGFVWGLAQDEGGAGGPHRPFNVDVAAVCARVEQWL